MGLKEDAVRLLKGTAGAWSDVSVPAVFPLLPETCILKTWANLWRDKPALRL